jgi:hypothetical protein
VKKTYPVSNNAKAVASWRKHLRKTEKRRVNKSTRKLGRLDIRGPGNGNDAGYES